jgi:hypothetical protein
MDFEILLIKHATIQSTTTDIHFIIADTPYSRQRIAMERDIET